MEINSIKSYVTEFLFFYSLTKISVAENFLHSAGICSKILHSFLQMFDIVPLWLRLNVIGYRNLMLPFWEEKRLFNLYIHYLRKKYNNGKQVDLRREKRLT